MHSIDLNGSWQLSFHQEYPGMPLTPQQLAAASWPQIPASVPGNYELDFVNAGLEEDPFFAENLYHFRKYEYYSFWYERTFQFDGEEGNWQLQFEGINTFADVFLNGTLIGQCDNMFIAHTLPAAHALKKGENHLSVHIFSSLNKAREKDVPMGVESSEGNHDIMFQRRAPHSAGWDIMPRFTSAGMWRGVSLICIPENRISQTYYTTLSATEEDACLLFKWRFFTSAPTLDDCRIRVHGHCGDSHFDTTVTTPFSAGSGSVHIPHPKRWWPRGYGEANLYTVTMELICNGQVLDSKTERIGLRKAEVIRHANGGRDNEFRVQVNGVPILCKGTNWVPLDAMHSRDAQRLKKAHDLLWEVGANIVRCWGGNVYEDHAFFDLCDERGILVWQDFAMACGIYPQDDEFCQEIEKEASFIIRKLRNHPSILIWAGDNEVDVCHEWFNLPENSRYNDVTRRVLPRAVRSHDPYRDFLPSSPYVPLHTTSATAPELHNWGSRDYYKCDFYKHTPAHFVSECGYQGCPNVESLKKFLPEDSLWPYTLPVWHTHSTANLQLHPMHFSRNQLTANQIKQLCGVYPDNIEMFSALSQISQAEALKYFVESTRLHKWTRTGMIWWNLLDGWPENSDSVVDYYFSKKRAFFYLQRVQQPICLMVDEATDWEHPVVLGNDSLESKQVSYRVTDADTGEVLLEGTALSPANENIQLGVIEQPLSQKRLLLLTWEVDGMPYGNHYMTGFPTYDQDQLLRWAQIIDTLPGGKL